MLHGLPRRSTAIAAGALLLSGALTSCGFDYATNRVNTISSSVNEQEDGIDVLGAAIISGAPGTGLFVATLANTGLTGTETAEGPDALVELDGDVAASDEVVPEPIEPFRVDNLYERGGIPVEGLFELGDFVRVELTFDSGQVTSLEVPVVRPCYEYDPGQFPAMELPGPVPEGETEFEAELEADGTTLLEDPYSCDPIEPRPFGHAEEGEIEEELEEELDEEVELEIEE